MGIGIAATIEAIHITINDHIIMETMETETMHQIHTILDTIPVILKGIQGTVVDTTIEDPTIGETIPVITTKDPTIIPMETITMETVMDTTMDTITTTQIKTIIPGMEMEIIVEVTTEEATIEGTIEAMAVVASMAPGHSTIPSMIKTIGIQVQLMQV